MSLSGNEYKTENMSVLSGMLRIDNLVLHVCLLKILTEFTNHGKCFK